MASTNDHLQSIIRAAVELQQAEYIGETEKYTISLIDEDIWGVLMDVRESL